MHFVRNFSKSFNAISNIDEQMQFLGTGLPHWTRYLHAKGCSPKPRFIKRSRGKRGIESRSLSSLKFQQKRMMDRCVLLATSWSTYWSTIGFFKILPTSRKRVSFTVIPCLEDSTVCCLTYGFVRSAEHILPIKQKDLELRECAVIERF